ncbi:MAG: ABC transporter ATP-binding protein [Acidimicrobiales bacterium]
MTLEVEGLRKRFGRGAPAVLDGAAFTVPGGSLTSLLGSSGAGKSTVLHIVAGLVPADDGSVRLDGRPLDRVPAHKRPLTMLLQRPNLFDHLDVVDNAAFGLRVRGRRRAERRDRAHQLLRLVGVDHLAGRWPRQLSGGEAQRVALARALATDPAVLLADEPFASVDAPTRRELQDLLVRLQRELAMTVVLVTHDRDEALALSDRLVVLAGGRIVDEGPPPQLHRRPRNVATAELLGMANHWRGTLCHGCLHAGPRPLLVSAERARGPIEGPRPARWAIRPEDIRIGTVGPNVWPGRIEAQRYLGSATELTVAVGELTVVARVAPSCPSTVGETVSLQLPVEALHELEES